MTHGTSRSRRSSMPTMTKKTKKKNKLVTRLSQIMFVGFFGVAGINGLNFKKTVNLQIDAVQKQVSTGAATVDQLLNEEGIDKSQYRILSNDDKVEADETIVLSSKKMITFTFSGNTKQVETYALTFGEFLQEQQIELNENTVLTEPTKKSDAEFIAAYKAIKIDTLSKNQHQVTVTLNLPEQIVETEDLLKGQVEMVPGEPKIITETYEKSFVNGTEVSNVKMSEVIVNAGKPAIKKVGKKALSADLNEMKVQLMSQAGIHSEDFEYANFIIKHESNWTVNATNASSGAYGLPQSLPGDKMATAGADWKTNPVTQLKWANEYAKSRYGGWKQAYDYWVANKVW